jgi:preprotein translocase subunit SecE
MWGFKSLLPCQPCRAEGWRAVRRDFDQTRSVYEMAQAAKLNKEESEHRVNGFSLLAPVDKLVQYPRRLRTFLHDVRVEMKQVNWPSRASVWSTTIVVIVTVGFFAVFFFMTDSILSKAEDWLFHFVKR